MFFDAHSDIGHHIVLKKLEGEKNIINKYHKYFFDNLVGGIICYYDDYEKPIIDPLDGINIFLEEIKPFLNKNIILGLEGLDYIDKVSDIDYLYNLGFRHAMLTWNYKNKLGSGVASKKGLTRLGKKIINRMMELNMIIDVSHASKKTFYDVMKIVKKPVIASHSNAKKLCNHLRNLDDNQLLTIKANKGVVCLTAINNFVNKDEPTIANYINHIKYVVDLIGIDHVGIGFDFINYLGQDVNLTDLKSVENSEQVLKELKKHFTVEETNKIAYKNVMRIIKKTLK